MDAADARRMLQRLSDRTHHVLTAVALDGRHRDSTVVETKVTFRALSPGEIDWYIRSGEPLDKAGGYAIQGRAGVFVSRLVGSFSGVMGLPLYETGAVLAEFCVTPAWLAPSGG